jgi:twinkle protein
MDFLTGDIEAIPNRSLTRDTCQRYGYRVGTFKGGRAHIAPYHDDTGRTVAQKVRFSEDGKKAFTFLGSPRDAGLFGSRLLEDRGGKMVVITEGEIDALSVSQAMGNTWPVLSVPNGAQGAARDIRPFISRLEKYESVVLAFDMDEPGRKAAEACSLLFTPGKVRIALLPEGFKDANDMVKAGKSKLLVDAVFGASTSRPDGIRSVADLRAKAMEPSRWGRPWPWVSLTAATYGMMAPYVYSWGAGVGSGKTTTMKQIMVCIMRPDLLPDHSHLRDGEGKPITIPPPRKVGCIFFEENPAKTLRSLAGMILGLRLNKPDVVYTDDQLNEAIDSLDGLFFPLDTFGAKDWATIKANILHLILVEGVLDIWVDPLTALVANADDERRELDAVMADISGIAETHGATIHLVSHLTTPAGTAHEEGGRVLEKHFTGSRAIARWSYGMLGLERDKQTDNPTLVRGLKDREFGEAVGPLLALRFDQVTGRMVEVDIELALNPESSNPFNDERTNHADL